MENNETMNNTVAEVATEVAETVAKDPTFAERHPHLAVAGWGVIVGAAVATGGLIVEATCHGVSKAINWGKQKNQERKDRKAAKKASEPVVIEKEEA